MTDSATSAAPTPAEPGQNRELRPNQAPLLGKLSLLETDICLDFCCDKGHYAHVDTYDPEMQARARYVRCGVCEDVYRLNAVIQLVRLTPQEVIILRGKGADRDGKRRKIRTRIERREANPNHGGGHRRADLQWKGTDVSFAFTCECGNAGAFKGMFMNQVDCAACGAVYHCNNRLQAILLTDDESKALKQLGIEPLVVLDNNPDAGEE